MIVVTGPNGNVGTVLVKQLVETDLDYRIAAHTPDKISRLYGEHVPRVKFDFGDSSTWPATLEGITTLFLLFPLPHPKTARTWMVPFVEAATRAGVKHIIYVSVPGADHLKMVPHHVVENAVRNSGVPYTILQAAFFSQNLSRDITTHAIDIAINNQLFMPAGKGLTSFIDSRDVAEVAVKIMRNPEKHQNKTYLLTGPEQLNYYQVSEMLSEIAGRKIPYVNPAVPRFVHRMRKRGITWDVWGFMVIVYFLTRFGKNAPQSDELAELLGRPPTTLRQYLEDYKAFWDPNSQEIKDMQAGIGKLITPFMKGFDHGDAGKASK
tara:strand:+ start:162757 stop:163722 length:966 start_codon:yes stop_codon:yes gene_type:complete